MIDSLKKDTSQSMGCINNFRFNPWIGSNYRRPHIIPHRVLVIGESQYLEEKDVHPNYNVDLCKEYAESEAVTWRYQKFWNNITQVLLGAPLNAISREDRKELWNSIAFYNFFQHFLKEPRQKLNDGLTSEEWEGVKEQAKSYFFSLLEDLKPESVIVLGRSAWHYLPDGIDKRAYYDKHGEFWIHRYQLKNNQSAYATFIRHPSAAFSWPSWHGRMQILFAQIEE